MVSALTVFEGHEAGIESSPPILPHLRDLHLYFCHPNPSFSEDENEKRYSQLALSRYRWASKIDKPRPSSMFGMQAGIVPSYPFRLYLTFLEDDLIEEHEEKIEETIGKTKFHVLWVERCALFSTVA